MILNLLTTVILWVYDRIKSITAKPDYTISHQSMEYTIDSDSTDGELMGFWKDESREEWYDGIDSFYKNLNGIDYMNVETPTNVTKIILRIKYWYNDKMYKFLSNDMNHEWPPKRVPGIVFHMPLVSAQLMDIDDKPVKDVLNKIKRYAGPRGDFHGNKNVKISDMLYYDDETLQSDYPSIKLKSALGIVKKVSTYEGYITDLQIP